MNNTKPGKHHAGWRWQFGRDATVRERQVAKKDVKRRLRRGAKAAVRRESLAVSGGVG